MRADDGLIGAQRCQNLLGKQFVLERQGCGTVGSDNIAEGTDVANRALAVVVRFRCAEDQ